MDTEALLNFAYTLDIGIYGLVGLFVAVTVLLMGLNIHSRWHWSLKGLATGALFGVWMLSYYTINDWSGLPSKGEIPQEFLFVWAQVVEPEEGVGKDPGRIYMIVKERHGADVIDVPRTFELPYDKALHDEVVAMMNNVCFGRQIAGEQKQGRKSQGKEKFKGKKVAIEWSDFTVISLPEKMGGEELQQFIRQNQHRNQRMLEDDIRREREREEARQRARQRQLEEDGVQVIEGPGVDPDVDEGNITD